MEESKATRMFKVLLRDFGYRVEGNLLIQNASRFQSDQIIGNCRSVMGAVEQLIPRIREDEFSARYWKIVHMND